LANKKVKLYFFGTCKIQLSYSTVKQLEAKHDIYSNIKWLLIHCYCFSVDAAQI